ncbi:RNHCP domain-containing protein [Candidatus Gracilibacteria bacterium]|nr:RNHCP domain-containing protein [Candidatus Gracilibacteria bacterium]
MNKKFTMINEGFECDNCSQKIIPHPTGSARNHCPVCLYSKHLDDVSPGDRNSECYGLMEPIGIDYKKNKGDMIKHKCTKCDKVILNQIAPDDSFLDFVKKINKQ